MDSSANVVVMMGGFSSEREVSLKTGEGVVQALTQKGHHVTAFDVVDGTLMGFEASAYDAAFIALHGEFGEDGGIQLCLEESGLAYTGSDAESSKLAMDKVAAKMCFADAGLRVAPHVHLTSLDELPKKELEIMNLGMPIIVKPVSEGSSIGMHLVLHHGDLLEAIDDAAQYQQGIMLEKFIPGRELTVGILGDRALPVVEIKPPDMLFDFSAKYSGQSEYRVPAPLDPVVANRVRNAALIAHRALGCRDVSRVDLRMEKDMAEPVILEVNTVPGLTATSLLPKAGKLVGLSYADLCQEILEGALARRPEPAGSPVLVT